MNNNNMHMKVQSAAIEAPPSVLSITTAAETTHKRSHSISAIDEDRSFKVIIFQENSAPQDRKQEQNSCKYDESFNSIPIKHSRSFSRCLRMSFSSATKFSKLSKPESLYKSYDSFKTWTGKSEKSMAEDPGDGEGNSFPAVNRYFDALKGPDLDTLRASEVLVLPKDKTWPFLLRFPISSFGMCLGVGSQAMLWKTLATSPTMKFINISLKINLFLWCASLLLFSLVCLIYSLKIIFYFEAVRREFYHPVRINFFFAPWIACLFLAIGLPPYIAKSIHGLVWHALMAPILCLELKIYGMWMSGGERRLSKVANPCNHLAVVGNFVGALLGASMGNKEGAIFFFAVGVAHYTVLFVTLYQRLPTNETLPKELHPVFFLFIATPSVACTAWATITGEFSIGARIPYFIAMFLYASLAVRVNFFRGFRFSLTWWAYTFPMAGSAIATIRYTAQVNNVNTRTLSISLAIISSFTALFLFICTILHGFVLHDLFPNDIAIAISHKKSKAKQHQVPAPDIEACKWSTSSLGGSFCCCMYSDAFSGAFSATGAC